MNDTDVEEHLMATREESSDESTVISSQTSTLTRNQGNCMLITFSLIATLIVYNLHLGHDEMQQQAVLAMSLQACELVLSDDEESDEEGEEEACGGASKEDAYDDGEFETCDNI